MTSELRNPALLVMDLQNGIVLTEKVFPRQADVMTTGDWIASLNDLC